MIDYKYVNTVINIWLNISVHNPNNDRTANVIRVRVPNAILIYIGKLCLYAEIFAYPNAMTLVMKNVISDSSSTKSK
mgnify:FL=1